VLSVALTGTVVGTLSWSLGFDMLLGVVTFTLLVHHVGRFVRVYCVGRGSGCVLLWVCVPISFARARTKSRSIKNDRRFLIFEKGWVNVY
jgi:hypothetical protein